MDGRMNPSLVAQFLFLPMLGILGTVLSGALLFRIKFSKGAFSFGMLCAFIVLALAGYLVFARWSSGGPDYYKPIWDVTLLPVLGVIVAMPLCRRFFGMSFSRTAFLTGMLTGFLACGASLFLFYGYFTG
jgi:hypothetical protein